MPLFEGDNHFLALLVNVLIVAELLLYGLEYDVDTYESHFLFLVENFIKPSSFSQDIELERRLNEFFEISTLTNKFSLIKVEEIVKKCIFLKNNNEYFISVCHDEEDHD